ncbi:hypothetical protein Tco_1320935 [Tanacetum coccineum]
MIDELSIVETNNVIHIMETDMVKHVAEIEYFGMSFDEFDKETGSSDGLQPKQADLSYVHALNEPHLHEIHVIPSKHEADQNSTTRKKKYEELSVTEKLQSDCDLKATNIVLQGLPANMYAIFNHHKVAKEIWDRVKLLMQGTKLSLQERECKLYDEFDKFSFVKGETLY